MIFQSIAGLVVFSLIAWAVSENRRKVRLKPVIIGIGIQVALGAILLNLSIFRTVFLFLNNLVLSLGEATTAGTSFVFGYLGGEVL